MSATSRLSFVPATAICSSILALQAAMPAAAQDVRDPGLEEVIVTATKREQRLQDIPAAVSAVTGAQLQEMQRNRSQGLCCGAGGGNMWQEEIGERRVNHVRTEEATNTGASSVISNCPFCIQMFEDGIPAVQPDEEKRSIRAFDIAEILELSVQPMSTVRKDGATEVPAGIL